MSENQPQKGNSLPLILGIGGAALVMLILGAVLLWNSGSTPATEETAQNTPAATAETAEGETETPTEPAETAGETAIAGEIALSDGAGTVQAIPATDFAGTTSLPAGSTPQSNVYTIANAGTGQATITVPGGVQATQDVLGWDGTTWQFVPSTASASGAELITAAGPLPQALLVVARPAAEIPAVSALVFPTNEDELSSEQPLPLELLPYLTNVDVLGGVLAAEGEIEGVTVAMPQGGYTQMLYVTNNSGAIIDQANIDQLLADEELRNKHLQVLLNAVTSGEFAGLNLDYRSILAGQASNYTLFVQSLAENLHAQNLKLAVTVPTPVQNADGSWDTAGYDVVSLAQHADLIYLQLPIDPAAYGEKGVADQLLTWAVRQVDRQKLVAFVTTNSVDELGGFLTEMPLTAVVAQIGTMETTTTTITPTAPITLALTSTATPFEWDDTAYANKFTYNTGTSDSTKHTVWIGNESNLALRLRLAKKYNLQGVSVAGLSYLPAAGGYPTALENYTSAQAEIPPANSASIVWSLATAEGSVIASTTGTEYTFAWEGSDTAGNYLATAVFAQGDLQATLGEATVVVAEPQVAEADPDAQPDEETEETEETGSTADANAVVSKDANVRLGPDVIYGLIANGARSGTRITVIGKDKSGLWYNIILPDGQKGWVYTSLVTLDAGVDVASLPEVEAPPPPVVVAPPPSSGGTTPPPAGGPPPPANLGGGFEIGGQTHTLANPVLMQTTGMKWVKFQHKWGCGSNPADVAGKIAQAHGSGFKVLLSMPGSPYPDSIDFNCYIEFLKGVAAQGPDAMEIWNEMNIDFEWPAGQIDPASYVNNMLKPAYTAIKGVNSNIIVISGALAPTGFDNGTNAWSDERYIKGMAAAGAANYMDCIGVHFNAGATSPSAVSGHPTGSAHYSWYFNPTLNLYYNAFGGSRKVCFTELGYLSGEGWGNLPPNFSWAGNTTIAQHAQWLAEAVSLSANSGKVRMLIVFNVDFTLFDGSDPQAGYGMVRKDGSCPACQTIKQVMGR